MCSNHSDAQNVILWGNPADDFTQCEPVNFKGTRELWFPQKNFMPNLRFPLKKGTHFVKGEKPGAPE